MVTSLPGPGPSPETVSAATASLVEAHDRTQRQAPCAGFPNRTPALPEPPAPCEGPVASHSTSVLGHRSRAVWNRSPGRLGEVFADRGKQRL